MSAITFTPRPEGWYRVTSELIPGVTITLAPPLLESSDSDDLGNWVSSIRDDNGRCLTAPTMVEVAQMSIALVDARLEAEFERYALAYEANLD